MIWYPWFLTALGLVLSYAIVGFFVTRKFLWAMGGLPGPKEFGWGLAVVALITTTIVWALWPVTLLDVLLRGGWQKFKDGV